MRNRSLFIAGLVLPALLVGLAACGGGGGSDAKDAAEDLILVEFSLVDQAGNPTGGSGTTNAYRNNRILFTFSEDLTASTVTDRTISIGIPSNTNLFLVANGRFMVDGNKVLFDPTVTSTGAPSPFGLVADSDYTVVVKGLPDANTILSVADGPVREPFTTTFHTTDKYLPDLDQPRAMEIDPPALDSNDIADLALMTPEERVLDNAASRQLDGNGDPIPGTGKWEQIWVDSGADVFVEFSEAMNPATFDPATTFRVVNLDRNSRDVLGVFLYSADATGVTFRPTFGFGRGPYLVQVTMTVGITDLAENPIGNPQQWIFLTEFDPTAVNEGLFEEYFDWSHADDVLQYGLPGPPTNNEDQYESMEDWNFSPPGAEGIAAWDPQSDPGKLASTFGTRTVTVPTPPGGSSNYIPLGGISWVSCRFQSWYKPGEMGNAGTISGLSFPVGSVITQGCVNTNFTVQIGHSSKNLTPGLFANNLNVGTPVTVISGVSWTMPTNMSMNNWVPFPPLTKSFGFNGTNNVVIDVGKSGCSGSGNTWSCRSGFDGNVRRIWNTSQTSNTSSGSDTGYTYPYLVSFRTESSMAQSLWFSAESNDPTYLDALVSPTDQPPGTETVLEYQGAHDDGKGVPDASTETAWTQDITDLDGHQYVRFRVRFTANLSTGVGPKLEEIVIPYIFF